MADITNVDLLWQRKVRGLAALGRYAVSDTGALLVSVPDELEARTRHIARYDRSGRSQIVDTYNVETLRRTEIGADGQAFAGITDDDLYLFPNGRKARFLPDRRASYTDLSLAATGQRFGAALCDLLHSGDAVALGDIGGRVLWTKDVPFAVSRVAVDREAGHLAVAGEQGELILLDAARHTIWTHRQDAALSAVATVGPERTIFAGGGGAGAVGPDGTLHWFTEAPGDLIEITTDAAGRIVVVLAVLDEGSGRVAFLSADGLPTWEIDFEESRPTGVALSPNGRHAAVSLRDGTIAVYALDHGERSAGGGAESILAEARAARRDGDPRRAIELLRARLEAVPIDTAACEALADTLTLLRERGLRAADTAEALDDWAAADAHLGEILSVWPLDDEVVGHRRRLRARWAAAARAAGQAALARNDSEGAEAGFLEAILADPLDAASREALARARATASAGSLARAEEMFRQGNFAEAVAAVTEAQARGAVGPDVAALLRRARVGEALLLGNQLYQDRQYAAALFQFKKALRLDPGNAEAAQKIGYARNFLQDTQLADRFTRLE